MLTKQVLLAHAVVNKWLQILVETLFNSFVTQGAVLSLLAGLYSLYGHLNGEYKLKLYPGRLLL